MFSGVGVLEVEVEGTGVVFPPNCIQPQLGATWPSQRPLPDRCLSPPLLSSSHKTLVSPWKDHSPVILSLRMLHRHPEMEAA